MATLCWKLLRPVKRNIGAIVRQMQIILFNSNASYKTEITDMRLLLYISSGDLKQCFHTKTINLNTYTVLNMVITRSDHFFLDKDVNKTHYSQKFTDT